MSKLDHALNIRWEHVEKHRFYRVYLHADLLGDLILTTVNGGIGIQLGQVHHQVCKSFDEALLLIRSIDARRQQRGYEKL